MTATWQFDVARTRDLLHDLLVERRRRRLIEFTAQDQRRHLEAMKLRHKIRFLQDFAGRLEGLRIDRKQVSAIWPSWSTT